MFITRRVPDISLGVINKDLHSVSGQNNKISRDVKGLFVGVTFVSCGVIISVVVKLQLEDELHVQVGCSVRRVKVLLGLSPLGLISRFLRGQERRCINLIKQEIRRKSLLSCRPWAKPHGWRS